MEPIINSQAPEFKVQAYHNGKFETVSSDDIKGKWAIFFFYPADFTFVCPVPGYGCRSLFCKYRFTLRAQSMARCF